MTDAIAPFHRGGKEVRYHEVTRRLAEQADIRVYTMRWWGHAGGWRDGEVQYEAISPLLPLYTAHRRSVRQALVFALCTLRLLLRSYDAVEADHMPYVQLFPLWLITRVRRVRFVVTWHEVWGPETWHDYLGPLGRIAWSLERAAMRLPDEILAASGETATRLAPYVRPTTLVTVAPNGVDLATARDTAPSSDEVDITVVGRFLGHKRLDLVLETVVALHRRGRAVTCRIIGDGPARDSLVALATDLGIASSVQFRHDVVDQAELYSLLKSAKVFLFTSEREGFGIAVLEALACGLPVVTTDAPDNLAVDLVRRSPRGFVVDPSVQSLVEAVEQSLAATDLDPSSRLGNIDGDVDAWLSAFDWTTVADKVLEACLR